MANMQLFGDARIILTFLWMVTIVFLSTAISKTNFYKFYFCNVKDIYKIKTKHKTKDMA